MGSFFQLSQPAIKPLTALLQSKNQSTRRDVSGGWESTSARSCRLEAPCPLLPVDPVPETLALFGSLVLFALVPGLLPVAGDGIARS
jgi:hypothetical protein